MEIDDIMRRVTRLDADVTAMHRRELEALLADHRAVRTWLDARHVAITRRLNHIADADGSLLPDDIVATAGGMSRRDARHAVRRAEVLDELPALDAALGAGHITAAHVDITERATRKLAPADRRAVYDQHEHLARVATHSTPDQFAAALQQIVARTEHDRGAARTARQRTNTALRTWVDQITGMVHLRGELDPERGSILTGRINRAVETYFHDALPDGCPDDERKQDHLRALALLHLTDPDTTNVSSGGADVIVVIDEAALTDPPTGPVSGSHSGLGSGRTWVSSGADLTVDTVRRLMCGGAIIPVVVNTHGVVLDVGREQRLATRAQRRALRAMHRTCAVPGCTVSFDHCQPHHITWWRHGGTTDLANLIPLCSRHHHAVHDGGWQLHLDAHTRELTVTEPDGTTMTTGPPRARSA